MVSKKTRDVAHVKGNSRLPSKLVPWTRVRPVEHFTLGKVQPVGVDPSIRDVHVVGTVYSDWGLTDVFIVRMDIVLLAGLVVL